MKLVLIFICFLWGNGICAHDIFQLVKDGDSLRLDELLSQNQNLAVKNNSKGMTPIHLAAGLGNGEIVRTLLQHGASPNTPCKRGEAPLIYAAERNSVSAANALLEHGANINFVGHLKATALMVAAWHGNLEVVNLLLSNNAQLDGVPNTLWDPIHCAAYTGRIHVLKALIQKKRSLVNKKSADGDSAIFWTIPYNQVEAMRLLVNRGADLQVKSSRQLTPIQAALDRGLFEMADCLIDLGCSINEQDSIYGMTLLHRAALAKREDVVKYLESKGADHHILDFEGATPKELTKGVSSNRARFNFVITGVLILLAAFILRWILIRNRAGASMRHLVWFTSLGAQTAISVISWRIFLKCDFYVIGTLVTGLWFFLGWIRAHGIKRTGRISQHLQELIKTKVLVSERINSPSVFGILRPVILFPEKALAWSPERIKMVLLHEAAHVNRHHLLCRFIGMTACALHWYNPLVWWVMGQMLLEQEFECDNDVIRNGEKPSAYALNLLQVADMAPEKLEHGFAGFGNQNDLKIRLMELLKPQRSKKTVGLSLRFSVMACTTALVLALTMMNPCAAEPVNTDGLIFIEDTDDYLNALGKMVHANAHMGKPQIQSHVERLETLNDGRSEALISLLTKILRDMEMM